MKILKINTIGLGAVVATSFLFLSCNKNNGNTIANTDDDFSNKTVVQVFVATVNAARTYVYVDSKPVTGAPLVSGSLFPASGYGFNVNAGLRSMQIKDTQTVTTQLPLTFAENMDVNKHYTIFMYDTITSPKQKTVLDNVFFPSDTTARLRFANFIYNPSTVPAVDVYSYAKGAKVFSNVAMTDVTDFISYPSRAPLDTLYLTETGLQTVILKVAIGTLTPKHNYTFVYRGSQRGTRAVSIYASY